MISIEEKIERESSDTGRHTNDYLNQVLGKSEDDESEEEDKFFYSDIGDMLTIGLGIN